MPSPFPGMDPYLEAPDIWPDFHNALAAEIRGELNHALPGPYYARLEMRPEVGIVEDEDGSRPITPDVVVLRHPRPAPAGGGVAVLDRPRREIAQGIELTLHGEAIRHNFIEIRDAKHGHKLITLIEILSPSNKRRGPDREAYRKKQGEVLDSDSNLIELDFLRAGDRVLPNAEIVAFLSQFNPSPDYLVLVSRAWRRVDAGMGYEVFPRGLHEWLPCIPVPLREGEPEVPLDLQFVANRAYEGGPYARGAVDYTRPPEPPLTGPDVGWAEALIREPGR